MVQDSLKFTRENIIAMLGRQGWDYNNAILPLFRLAKAVHRHAERGCNVGYGHEKAEARAERRDDLRREEIIALCATHNTEIQFQEDCRGAMVKVGLRRDDACAPSFAGVPIS